MSVQIPTFFPQQFANTIALLSQQMTSKLEGTVQSGSHTGEQASPVDQFAKIEALENNERFSAMPRVDADLDRRWVLPRDFDLPQLVQPKDLLRMVNDPKSQMAANAVAAMNRKKDIVILEALNGVNLTGKSGATSTSLPATQVVSVNEGGTASKLNVAKIRAAKRILMSNDVDVDAEMLTLVVNAAAHDALLAEVQATSKDYNEARDGKPILVDGKIARFMGFNIVHCERAFTGTDDAAGTSTALFAYAQSGAYMGNWQDVKVDIRERPDLRDIPYQVYVKMTIGATRLDEKKVVRLWSR